MSRAAKTSEQFVAELVNVNPDVETLSPYVNARTKVACRCRTCGFEWESVPNHLLRGSGCPRCAGTLAIDPSQFASRVACNSPDVELLGTYVNARTRIECQCAICGKRWSPYPRSLLQGHGCPECAKRATAQLLADRNRGAGKKDTASEG